MKDYFYLSFNNLRRKKLRSWLTMIGIFIGIAAVVSLISLGTGLQTAITGQFSTLSADKLTVQNAGTGFGPPGSTSVRKLTEHDLDVIKNVNGVQNVIPRWIRIAKVEYNKANAFDYMTDIPEDIKSQEIVYDSLNPKIEDGRILKVGDKGKIVLGSNVADTEFSGKKVRVGSKVLIQGQEFEVVGILKESSSFQLNLIILMMHDDMKNLLNLGDEIDLIIVQLADKDKAEQVATSIENKLRKDRGEKLGEEDFSVQTPLQAISSINTVLDIINIVVTGIAAISLVVGGIGIMNTMYTSVLERKREIGVMKAIGAKNSDILTIFLMESGLLGLAGGVIGIAIGLSLAFAVSGIANAAFGSNIISVQISYPLVFEALIFSLFIGMFAGAVPAYQASKLKPVDALRG